MNDNSPSHTETHMTVTQRVSFTYTRPKGNSSDARLIHNDYLKVRCLLVGLQPPQKNALRDEQNPCLPCAPRGGALAEIVHTDPQATTPLKENGVHV